MHPKYITRLLLAACLLSTGAMAGPLSEPLPDPAEMTPEQTRLEAESLYLQREYGLAIRLYQRAGRGMALSAEDRYRIGRAFHHLGEREQARIAYQEVLADFPDDYWTVNALGTMDYEDKNYPSARAWFERCTQIAPNETAAWKNLALLDHDEGRWDLMKTHLESALALDAADPLTLSFQGDYLTAVGDWHGAKSAYERAIRSNPELNLPRVGLSRLSMLASYDQQDITSMRALYLGFPSLPILSELLGRVYIGRGLHGPALAVYSKMNPTDKALVQTSEEEARLGARQWRWGLAGTGVLAVLLLLGGTLRVLRQPLSRSRALGWIGLGAFLLAAVLAIAIWQHRREEVELEYLAEGASLGQQDLQALSPGLEILQPE